MTNGWPVKKTRSSPREEKQKAEGRCISTPFAFIFFALESYVIYDMSEYLI